MYMCGADAPGQRWNFTFQSSIQSNILWLPEQRLQQGAYDAQWQPGQRTIPFRMEGDVFGPSGIAQVGCILGLAQITCSALSVLRMHIRPDATGQGPRNPDAALCVRCGR